MTNPALCALPALAPTAAHKGLLESDTPEEQAAEAEAIINEVGLLPEQNVVLPSHWFLQVPQAIAVTYANAYGRFGVLDDLCGYSFGATDPATGAPVPLASEAEAALFGTASGIPPTGGVDLINDLVPGGPMSSRLSVSPSTGRGDENLDGAFACGRSPPAATRLPTHPSPPRSWAMRSGSRRASRMSLPPATWAARRP